MVIPLPPPEWIPVVSGLVGAGGAIGAQIAGGFLTSRRENRAVRVRRADARAAAFVAEKRDLFVRVLKAIDGQLKAFDSFQEETAKAASSKQKVELSIPTGAFDTSKWEEMSAEVDLLVPDVIPKLNACVNQLQALDLALLTLDPKKFSDQNKVVREKRAELRDAMRVSLNVADAPKTQKWGRTRATKSAEKKQKG